MSVSQIFFGCVTSMKNHKITGENTWKMEWRPTALLETWICIRELLGIQCKRFSTLHLSRFLVTFCCSVSFINIANCEKEKSTRNNRAYLHFKQRWGGRKKVDTANVCSFFRIFFDAHSVGPCSWFVIYIFQWKSHIKITPSSLSSIIKIALIQKLFSSNGTPLEHSEWWPIAYFVAFLRSIFPHEAFEVDGWRSQEQKSVWLP